MSAKRKIKQNIWRTGAGIIGTKSVEEFGEDDIAARTLVIDWRKRPRCRIFR